MIKPRMKPSGERVKIDATLWRGGSEKKPWEYRVTVALPVRGHPDWIERVLALLRLQTIRPYFIIVDTGSHGDDRSQIERFAADDCEVHFLNFNGLPHWADAPAIAMDLAFASCTTEYCYATHQDCFPVRQDLLEWLVDQCNVDNPFVGYQITPRKHDGWEGMISHSCSMFHMPSMDRINATWSPRRICRQMQREDDYWNPRSDSWPDTETAINEQAREQGYEPVIAGTEENRERTLDGNIDHCRSGVIGQLWGVDFRQQHNRWIKAALDEADDRIKLWSSTEPKAMDRITAIIPTRGVECHDLLRACFDSLFDRGRFGDVVISGKNQTVGLENVVIVDDGGCGIPDDIANDPMVQVVETTGVGFSAAVNAAFESSVTTELALVINNDCEVTAGCVSKLRDVLSGDPLAAAISPVLTDEGGCSKNNEFVRAAIGRDQDLVEKRTHLPWTCVMVRRSAWDRVGELDADQFPSGLYADDDWCLRANANGFHMLFCGSAVAIHDESQTFKRLGIDYQQPLIKGRINFLRSTNVLACVIGCDRKRYSLAGVNSVRKMANVGSSLLNWEGTLPDNVPVLDHEIRWEMPESGPLPSKPGFDQDQFYRLSRIITARNQCLDVVRLDPSITHILFIDSDVAVDDPATAIPKLLDMRRPIAGGFCHGRGDHSNVEMIFGERTQRGSVVECDWGTCGFMLINRLIAERYQFRWGRSKVMDAKRSEDPALCEDLRADGWQPFAVDRLATATHVDNEREPLTAGDVSQF